MKLLIVGSALEGAIEKYYLKYIKEANCEVKLHDIHGDFIRHYNKHIFNKISYRIGISSVLKDLNRTLIDIVNQYKPTHIWVFKGMEIYPQTLIGFRQQGIKLINYNPDNPFIFTGKGSGNKNITNSIGLYDLHFTYSRDIQNELERKYAGKTAYLPFACDVSEDLYEKVQRQDEIVKVCFLGNPDKQRARFLNELVNEGIEIDLYGNNWNKFVSHPNFSIHGSVSGISFWEVLYRYRIQLNVMRIHNEDAHNMRTFEIGGIGGIQLAPRTKEHESFFLDGEEIFLYDNVESCVGNINKILSLSTTKALYIRCKARKSCIERLYSYKERAIYAVKIIDEFL